DIAYEVSRALRGKTSRFDSRARDRVAIVSGKQPGMIGRAGRGRRMGVLLIAAGLLALAAAPAALCADRIYWGNRGNNTISYANLDNSGGGGQLDISGSNPNEPHGLTIDLATGRIYWTNLDSRISYTNVDGSGGGGELNLSGATEKGAVGLAVD